MSSLLSFSMLLAAACSGSGTSPASSDGGSPQASSGGTTTSSSGGTSTAEGGASETVGQGGALGFGGASGAATGGAIVTVGGSTSAGGASTGPLDVYASPTGLASNPGTQDAPTTLQNAVTIQISKTATAQVTVWVMPGTYTMTAQVNLGRSGSTTNPGNVLAVAGSRPVIDFAGAPAGSYGFAVSGRYYHIKGLEITNARDNCINISGSYNTIEDVVVHNCLDTGIQITVPSASAGNAALGAYNSIINCDSYTNADATGENADGFAAKLRIGAGNSFKGCRAWNNSDDGWDLYASNDVVTMDNCWAFLNGSGSAGDGNGFKLGGASDGTADQGGAVHLVSNCVSVGNKRGWGYTRNNNTSVPKVTTSFSATNKSGDCTPTSMCTGLKTSALSTTALQAARLANASLPSASQ